MVIMASCKTNTSSPDKDGDTGTAVSVPDFNADNAYNFVKAQVDFGPRVPNTKAHEECGDYLAGKLQEYGAKVTNQRADLVAYDGTILKARNIIGSYDPDNKKRVLLFAHWDTRPWSDNDPDPANHHTPVMGANDGASGVGALLEMARLFNEQAPAVGVDIIFFDAEDYGVPQFSDSRVENSWCLGSQYWARYPHVPGYNARFGILLDMVGGKGATFYREGYSDYYAKSITNKVWKKARELGYNNYFIDQSAGGAVTDDHLYVNEIIRIPSIDIIPNDPGNELSGFGGFWHTVNDTMENIDRETLKAVGQTVLAVVYNEK